MRTLYLILGCCLLMSACQPAGGGSDSWPTRPITYLVPWSPGGGTDMASRSLAAVLQESLGQPVNVVNRTGGGGVVGHLALAQAPADGYTIGAVTVEITMMHWQGLTELSPADYAPLGLLTNNYAAITVQADAPWNTAGDLVEAIKASPGEYKASGTSRGGIWDLARAGFLQRAGLEVDALPWVPSQGAAPALQELIAGGVDVVTAALAEVDAMRQAGEVKVLGVMAPERLAAFPEVPTLAEQGIDWSLGGWVGVGAPAGLPEPIRMRLDSAIQVAMQDSAFIQAMERGGYNLQPEDASGFERFMAEQDALNGSLIESVGMAK